MTSPLARKSCGGLRRDPPYDCIGASEIEGAVRPKREAVGADSSLDRGAVIATEAKFPVSGDGGYLAGDAVDSSYSKVAIVGDVEIAGLVRGDARDLVEGRLRRRPPIAGEPGRAVARYGREGPVQSRSNDSAEDVSEIDRAIRRGVDRADRKTLSAASLESRHNAKPPLRGNRTHSPGQIEKGLAGGMGIDSVEDSNPGGQRRNIIG